MNNNINRFNEFKDKNLPNKENINKWLNNIKKFSKREALETRVASKILRKIIRNKFKITVERPTEKEIAFLKQHSKDLVKILGLIASTPTPIPYVTISLILNKLGIKLLPSKEDLEIPE